MYLDEYERGEGFDKQWRAIRDAPELVKVMKEKCYHRFDALIVPESRKSEVWTEVEKLRVEFK
jgi:hypothetical protein